MFCVGFCATTCFGSGCGYSSECVGAAGCNPTLCGSCITGSAAPPVECVTSGSMLGICGNPCITPCLIPNTNISCAMVNQQGPCTPCSPLTCGTTCQLPYCNPDACRYASGPKGGGSGA